jgi:hypothetical protein
MTLEMRYQKEIPTTAVVEWPVVAYVESGHHAILGRCGIEAGVM